MNKRLFCIFLTLCMAMTMLPVTAITEEVDASDTYEIWVGGVQVTDINKDNISGTGIIGDISYDPATSTLTLNESTISAVYEKTENNHWGEMEEHQYGIYAGMAKLKIVVSGENIINCPDASDKYSYGIYTSGALEVSGTGSLYANSGNGSVAYGIYSISELTIKSGTITGISNAIWTSLGIYGNKINIFGGNVDAYSIGGSAHSMVANSFNITGGKVTVTGKNGLSANTKTYPINISGGEVNATVSENAISGALNFKGGTVIASGEKALNGTLNLINGIAAAGTNRDGSDADVYDEDNLGNYKYLKIEPNPDDIVTAFNLTGKLTPPATGGTPTATIIDDQYAGAIAWSGNPTVFLGNRVYTATVTLTAKNGYTFSGVAENAFFYNGATSITSNIGSDKTMIITIVFPQTTVRALQQIIITTPPTKTTYYYGENFDKTGMIVKASYDDGTIDENFIDYTVDKIGHLTISDNLITLTANGTAIKTTQAITVLKKTPTTADLAYDLVAVAYDSMEKPVSVVAAPNKNLGAITVKYNGGNTPPTNAGIYTVKVDIAESTEYNAAADLLLGNYTINKIDYRGNSALSESVFAYGKIGASIILPDIPEGANYGTPVAQGTIMMSDIRISGNTLIYTAPESIAGQNGTMTIPVTGATNYKDYNIVVTINYTAKVPQMISYAATNIINAYGDAKFINPLTQTTVNGPITYTSDDSSVATVNPSTGEVSIISVGDGNVTITATAMETDTHAEATASYTVIVSKRALILKADNKNMIQGDELPGFSFTAIGLVNDDIVITAPTISCTTNGATVGTFDIIPSGGAVRNASSYDITYTKGILTVAGRLFIATVTDGTGSGNYAEGQIVTITANDRNGYTFIGWGSADITFADTAAKTTVFTMPAKAVHITANYLQNGSGDSGGSIIITPPAPDKPDFSILGESKGSGTTNGKDNITMDITDKIIINAFDKALADANKNGTGQNGITVVLHMDTGIKNCSDVTVNLPKTVQDIIIAKKIVNTIVVVNNPDIRIGMDLGTVKEINKQAKSDVNITATRVDGGKLSGEAQRAIGGRPAFDLRVNYGNGKHVQSFGLGRVSVAIPYTLAINEKAGNVQAVYVDARGEIQWLINSIYDNIENVLSFSTDHFSTYGIGYKQINTIFADIEDHWARGDIEFVVGRGLFSGTSSTTYSPNAAMTRGMFITALGRLANANVDSYTKSSFSDVNTNAYYMGYIEWACKNNIVNGVGNGRFSPDQAITREQMAVIIGNYTKATGLTLPKAYEENAFADNNKISTYAKEAVKQMQMAGAINGKNSNFFDPQGTATRGEVSVVLRRFIGLGISNNAFAE